MSINNIPTKPAWKNLGKDVEYNMTVEEAIRYGKLDFTVGLEPVYVKYDEETEERIGTQAGLVPDTMATYRTDTGRVFSAVGSRYEVVQNIEVFEFFNIFLKEGRAVFEQVGMLNGGGQIFLSAKLDRDLVIDGLPDELIENYLLLVNSHDGSSSVQVILMPMRISCWNQLPGISSSNKIMIRHTRSAHMRIEEAMQMITTVDKFIDQTSELYSELARIKVSDAEVRDFYNIVFLTSDEYESVQRAKNYRNSLAVSSKKKNILDTVNYSYHNGIAQENIIGTMYGAINGIVHYFQNLKTYRDEEQKMSSMFLGGTDSRVISKAVQIALTYKSINKTKEDGKS